MDRTCYHGDTRDIVVSILLQLYHYKLVECTENMKYNNQWPAFKNPPVLKSPTRWVLLD